MTGCLKVKKSVINRIRLLIVLMAGALFLVYGFLPFLTKSFEPLRQMSVELETTGIDPSRYYYTDVEQVKEAEQYLESALSQ